MNSQNVVVYKPLLEVIDFHGNKYYSEASYEEMSIARQKQELIDFGFSGDCVKSSQIVRHRLADQEEVMMAWKMKQLGYWKRQALEAGLKAYQEHWHYCKPITETLIDRMIENLKANKNAWAPITNG